LEKDVEAALSWRPELARLRLQRERILVDLDLARNQMLPGLNLGLEGYQDVGYGSSYSKSQIVKFTALDRTTYIASLQFDLPVQRRDARGRILTSEALLVQLSQQERFQVDRIRAEVQDASSALTQAYLVLQKAREGIQVARRVEAAETERFSRGQGTVVILNLRELATAEAYFAEIDALAEYYRSLADLRAAIGVDGAAPAPAPLPGKPPLLGKVPIR
jgi:outer membrane protein TolC